VQSTVPLPSRTVTVLPGVPRPVKVGVVVGTDWPCCGLSTDGAAGGWLCTVQL
jgi:hypothetical protein